MTAVPRPPVRTRSTKHVLPRRRARVLGLAGLAGAAALPAALWHDQVALVAQGFRLELDYLVTGWTAYALLAAGIAFLVPVVLSIGRDPDSRFYPRGRAAYTAWGLVLYLLGFMLATQVAGISRALATG